MSDEYRGYYTSCPIHGDNDSENGVPYLIDWRGRGKEIVGHYFPCCGSVCLKSTKSQFNSVKSWLRGGQKRKPRTTSLWVKEALEGDEDIWRERGELDATYGFGETLLGEKPEYKVHEALTYLHTLDENIGEVGILQLFMVEPHMVAWEMDEAMSSPEMHDDIRKHYNVKLFQLVNEKAAEKAIIDCSILWLQRHGLLTPDPFKAVQSLYRLMAKQGTIPKNITMKDIETVIRHSEDAGFDADDLSITSWFDELSSYGVELHRNDRHPDFVP